MGSNQELPLGLRLRRARRAAGLSQAALASRAGVSQPLVSYYEHATGEPEGEGLAKIAEVLGLSREPGGKIIEGAVAAVARPARVAVSGEALPPADRHGASLRAALLATLQASELAVAILDRPAPGSGGDVAFAVETRNHTLIALIDGTGAGAAAGWSALLQAGVLLGALRAIDGVIWPDELLEAAAGVPERFGQKSLAATFVALIERRHRELAWATSRFPAVWIRNRGRTAPLHGERTAHGERGRISLESGWMLLAGTDGFAHAEHRGRGSLFESRAVRHLLQGAHDPGELIQLLDERTKTLTSSAAEDALALAVAEK